MRITRAVTSIILLWLVHAAESQGQINPRLQVNPHLSRIPPQPSASLPALAAAPRAAQRAAGANVSPAVCPPDAQALGASACGNVSVPLDRTHRIPGNIPIYFELYTHSAPGPAESAIVVNLGGPGDTTTANRGLWTFVFGPNLDVHDLLLIDDRGRGLSGTILCPDLQFGNTAFVQGVEECAAQLGPAISSYGTGDIAEDTDAVRAALGYQTVDYYGGSYGGADVAAYATRFGEHLRSIVLDAPFGTPAVAESRFVLEHYRTQAEPRMVSLDCQRSPSCSADHPVPELEFDFLVWAIRASPIEGDAYDANGTLRHVRVDENVLLDFIIDPNPTGLFSNTGEILAAARSLWAGDSRPLLRLGAEAFGEGLPLDLLNYGDPTAPGGFSRGAFQATYCADVSVPFAWNVSVPERIAQYAAAATGLPPFYFEPFSADAATGENFSFVWSCQYWEKPTPSSPIVETNARYPTVPTLVLTGDLDNRVPHGEVVKVAALFPESTLVSVESAGHETILFTQCAQALVSEFIESRHVPDTSCARTPETIYPAVGRFPLLARDARPATPDSSGQNGIGAAELKVVTVAVATATDALQRSIIGSGLGVGLRGGTFSTNYGASWTTTLANCAYAADVVVNGTVTWVPFGSFAADLTVSGSGTSGGTLHVVGTWQASGPVGNFTVSGTLGGKKVAALVPEA